MKWTNKE